MDDSRETCRRRGHIRDRDALPKLHKRMRSWVERVCDQMSAPSSALTSALEDLDPSMENLRASYRDEEMQHARRLAGHVIETLDQVIETLQREGREDLAGQAERFEMRMHDLKEQMGRPSSCGRRP